MKAQFCQYCGSPLNEHCDCLRELAELEVETRENYENSPETHLGWRQQDLIDLRRREQ